MGIRDLFKNIQIYAPSAISTKKLENYKGSIICIDSESLLYRFIDENESVSLNSFIKFTITYLNYGIIPVFVFDGKPPMSKQETTVKRREKKEQSIQRKQELTEELEKIKTTSPYILASEKESEIIDKIYKETRNNPIVAYEYRVNCKKMLASLGLPVINTSCEAEAYCVKMLVTGMVDYIYGNDSDIIAYTVAQFIKRPELLHIDRHFKIFTDKKDSVYKYIEFQEYNINKILMCFEMNSEQFLKFCILSGTDYNSSKRVDDLFSIVKTKDIEFDIASTICYNTFINPDETLKIGSEEISTDLQIVKDRAITTFTVKRPSISLNIDTEELKKFKNSGINILGILMTLHEYGEKYNQSLDYTDIIGKIT